MSKTISWQDYQQATQAWPTLFAWQLAEKLGVSEAQLKQACVGHGVRRLAVNPMKLLTQLLPLGDLLAITDNGLAVNEITGSYKNPRIDDGGGMFLNPCELDLRVFPRRWRSVFAVAEQWHDGATHQSLQFFDESGNVVHRVYATKQTDMQQWQQLLDRYSDEEEAALLAAPPARRAAERNATAQEVERYWRDMVDVHQFAGLLKTFALTRQQAFALVSDELARKVSRDSAHKLLKVVQHAGNAIMIFTGNQGCVQIYTGPLATVTEHDNWLTVKGNHFSYHLNHQAVAECWVVKKPVGEGFVTSLEFFDEQGQQISQLYGSRREGETEQARWHDQVNALV